MRREAHQVVEPELEIQRISLRTVDDIGYGDDLNPAPKIREVARSHATGARSQAAQERFDLFLEPAAAVKRREATRQSARRDRSPVAIEDALRHPIPDVAALEVEIRRRRRHRREHRGLFVLGAYDRHQLTREEAEAIRGERGKRGDGALPKHGRLSHDPIEEHPLQLLEAPREATQRARRRDPDERLGVQEKRLKRRERTAHERLVGHRRDGADGDLEATRGQDAATHRPLRRHPDEGLEDRGRVPNPRAKFWQLQGRGACLPDQDLEPRTHLEALGCAEFRSVSDQRRARQRVDHRAGDDPLFRHADQRTILSEGLHSRGEHRRHIDVAPPRRARAPTQEERATVIGKERLQGLRFAVAERWELVREDVGRSSDVIWDVVGGERILAPMEAELGL